MVMTVFVIVLSDALGSVKYFLGGDVCLVRFKEKELSRRPP